MHTNAQILTPELLRNMDAYWRGADGREHGDRGHQCALVAAEEINWLSKSGGPPVYR